MRSPIEHFLEEYRRELTRLRALSPSARRRVIAEARDHLRESARLLDRGDLNDGVAPSRRDPDGAERAAVQRFGRPEILARAWLDSTPSSDGRVLSAWLLLTPFGLAAGVVVMLALGELFGALIGMMLVVPLAGLVVGSGMGAGQWLSVPGRLPRPQYWIAATGAGVCCGLTASSWAVEQLGFVKGNRLHEAAALAIIGSVTGLVVAGLQRAVSRRLPPGAVAWLLRTALGMGAGAAIAAFLTSGSPVSFNTRAGFLLVALAAGTASALLTAPALRRAL